MSAAKVQLECKWINTKELIQTHHTRTHSHICHSHHTQVHLLQPYIVCMDTCYMHNKTFTHWHRLTNKHTLTHVGFLSGDTCVSACFHCCPLGCAVLHTVLPACLSSETRHLWILLEWYTSPSLDPLLMLKTFHLAHTLYKKLTLLYLLDRKVKIMHAFLCSWSYLFELFHELPVNVCF